MPKGALSGDVAAARISIEDGAFFKGGIDIRKPDGKSAQDRRRMRAFRTPSSASAIHEGHEASQSLGSDVPLHADSAAHFATSTSASARAGGACVFLANCAVDGSTVDGKRCS